MIDKLKPEPKFNLTQLKPIMESDVYAIYQLGFINENKAKGVRVTKKDGTQTEVELELKPTPRVVTIITKDRMVHIR